MRMIRALILTTALVLPVSALADAATITVTGEATVAVQPDLATLSMGVTTQGATATEAMAANTAALAVVLERLRGTGIAERDLQTSNLSLSPNWVGYESGSTPTISGYTATNMLTVRVRALDSLGSVLDAAITDGANTLNGLTFELAEPRPKMDEARVAAMGDATARAKLLVEAAGAKLGPVISINEGGNYVNPTPMFRAEASAAPVPTVGGEIGVTASVTMVFKIAE
ncbi:MAG: SIMPL domain-containing protein [Paracoccaceae bacterium]